MKGLILAAGKGRRLAPLTQVVNKVLLPVYNKPMIFHVIEKMKNAGITEIGVVIGPQDGKFLEVLGDGSSLGVSLTYIIQSEPLGTADAIAKAEGFIDGPFLMMFGDSMITEDLSAQVSAYPGHGAVVLIKQVPDPRAFGVVELTMSMRVLSIEEKPLNPKSDFVQIGVAIYDSKIFDYVKTLSPSDRKEYEFTDINKKYLVDGNLKAVSISGDWVDAGTFDGYLKAQQLFSGK